MSSSSRWLAAGLPIALVSTMAGFPAAPAAAAAKAAVAASACPASVADEAAALITARLCDGPVGIDAATSETALATALPSGQVQRTISAAPVRVRQNGQWVPVDLTLVRNADGTVSPKAAPSGLVISGPQTDAGEHPLATAGTGVHQVSMAWTGKLAEPVLDGDRATYPEAMPGVDLVVQGTRAGAETFLIVKTKAAAAQVTGLKLPVTGTAVASYRDDAAGNVTLLDAGNRPVATAPQPLMWDARTVAGTGEPADVRAVGSRTVKHAARSKKPRKALDGAGVERIIAPAAGFFADPATRYPVTIDPQINPLSTTFDTYVRQNDTVDRSGANDLELGVVSGNATRSFVHWDTSAIRGKQITSASVYFWNWWSPSCSTAQWEIWTTGAASADTRWGSQPAWNTKEATSTGTKGFSSACDDAWVSINGQSFFQRAADNWQSSRAYMGIRATSETDGNAFKQFRSRNAADSSQVPYAVVNYNSYPTVQAVATSPAAACATGANRPYLNTLTPTLKATLTDAESSPVKGTFEWYNSAGTKLGGATTATAASGSVVSTTVPAAVMTNGGWYSWRVQANDGTVGGDWSGKCEFVVDTTVPTVGPKLSSSTYPTGGSGGGPGVAGTFSFDANGTTDAAAFLYGLDTNPPTTAVNASTLGGSATVAIAPATGGTHTLYARSRDRAGNLSPITSYPFTVSNVIGTMASPRTGDLSAGKVTLSSAGAATSTAVTYQWRRAETDTWTTVPAADVVPSSGGGTVTWPLATTGSGKFADLTWNIENTVNAAEAGPDALDGPVEVRASYTGGTSGTSDTVRLALDRNRADAPSSQVGAGDVNLLTGNLSVSTSDAQAAGPLSVGRTFNTRQAGIVDPLFGPGWVSSAAVAAPDTYRTLTVAGSLVQIGIPDGNTLGFTKRASTSTGATFAPQVGDEALTLEYFSGADQYVLTAGSGNSTTFTRATGDPAGVYSPTSAVEVGTGNTTALYWTKSTVNGTDMVRPTQVVAPAPAGVNCAKTAGNDPLTTKGCKTLTYAYATTTTATASAAGDYAGRLQQLYYTAYDPAKSAMATVVVAGYSYDPNGRLSASWDPRLAYPDGTGIHQLATGYTYDADGILSTLTPPGQLPWQLAYTTVPGDAGKGRLAKVTRSALSAGTAVTSIVYRVPRTGTGAPADLSAGQTARWGQNVAPVDATAVFPPTQVPDGNQALGTMPSSWRQAQVTYLDGNAREVNDLQPGSHMTATRYDTFGNVTQELTAANRERALGSSASDTAAAEATLAANLSTVTRYSSDGERVVDTLGPEHDVVLSDWSTDRARTHTTYRYDENAKDPSQTYNLVTSKIESTQYFDSTGKAVDADSRTTTTQYDWDLRQPTAVIVDPQGLALKTRMTYDPAGRPTTTTLPAGDGTTAATRTVLYYRAGTGSGDDACDNHAEWVDLPCRTVAAAQTSSDPELPTTYTRYDMYGQPTVLTETNSGGTLRTTTIGYDVAGRPASATMSATADLGTPVEKRRSVYDTATGQLVRTEQLNASDVVTATIVRTVDTLGRITSYTDAAGNLSTTSYDVASRTQGVDDGKAVRTFSYDDAGDGRGLPNQVVDGQAGTFTAAYDADGQIKTENRPDGLTVNRYYDEEGAATGIEYLRGTTTVYADHVGVQAQGQWQWQWSTLQDADYLYDAAGRLSTADQTVGTGGCQSRKYTLDKNSNRTGLTTYGPGTGGACQLTSPSATRAWTFDEADRTSSSGYQYDNLGRALTVPAADVSGGADAAMTYYANDLTRTITQGTSSTTSTLDVLASRFGGYSNTVAGTTVTHVNHYADDSDNPAWIADGTAYTRAVKGLGGLEALYTGTSGQLEWQITDLHDDVVAMALGGTAGLTATYAFDEYGVAGNGSPRYGYLGADQRSADNTGGVLTMGVRLYSPATGRFLQTDPVVGGNANPYDYCVGNPVGCTDTTGKKHIIRKPGAHWYSPTSYIFSRDITNRVGYLFNYYGNGSAALAAAYGALLCTAGSPLAMAACGLVFLLSEAYIAGHFKAARDQNGCLGINNYGYMFTDHSKYCHRT
ncbi:hypothetical protein GCM10010172_66300 [Paractinoplanes ferrugineus]|uniref:RHS repeat-associated protein n=1 Tax=Paractinoplanes ferrugineus TaxID=113564 RepID=A0A919J5Y9_9ACTN|nr:RHS repeat-associated core domain-containing protein [Actinoplanes ferrugineus]GIE13209.1 hypothetical protein Afe05nite_50490 [Actinoplanes ferrugineus]